jgi:hypothetical protein
VVLIAILAINRRAHRNAQRRHPMPPPLPVALAAPRSDLDWDHARPTITLSPEKPAAEKQGHWDEPAIPTTTGVLVAAAPKDALATEATRVELDDPAQDQAVAV